MLPHNHDVSFPPPPETSFVHKHLQLLKRHYQFKNKECVCCFVFLLKKSYIFSGAF